MFVAVAMCLSLNFNDYNYHPTLAFILHLYVYDNTHALYNNSFML